MPIFKLFFFPPYKTAGIKPSDLNLLICPAEAVDLFVAFKTFINRTGVFILCYEKKQVKLFK